MAELLEKVEEKEKTIFVLSAVLMVLWVLGQTIDLNSHKIAGTIFAFLWFPMIGLLFVLPVINLTMLIKRSVNFKAYWIYGLLVNMLTLLLLCKLP